MTHQCILFCVSYSIVCHCDSSTVMIRGIHSISDDTLLHYNSDWWPFTFPKYCSHCYDTIVDCSDLLMSFVMWYWLYILVMMTRPWLLNDLIEKLMWLTVCLWPSSNYYSIISVFIQCDMTESIVMSHSVTNYYCDIVYILYEAVKLSLGSGWLSLASNDSMACDTVWLLSSVADTVLCESWH